jgi:hypothetical protein
MFPSHGSHWAVIIVGGCIADSGDTLLNVVEVLLEPLFTLRGPEPHI